MNKNNSTGNCLTEKLPIKQFLRIMRISIILLFTCVFCSMAESAFTQNAKVTLNKRNASLKEVLNEIESQTDYLFIYNDEVNANKKISVNAKSERVADVLNAILKDTDISYSMEGNHIILFVNAKEGSSNKDESFVAQQQKKTITGKVIDANGVPIIGANIVEVGTTNGTVTDVDGNFSLEVANNAVIRVSYIGYLAQEINTTDKTMFNITLLENTQALEEVVVVGYGTQKKVNLTGAVTVVDGNQLTDRPVANMTQLLQGVAPNVNVTMPNGMPGQDGLINIRGIGSISGSTSPLVLIDNVEGNINNINPYDVESITVLKDASAAAVYGARAAYGVILVTTKSGKSGKPRISYNGMYGFSGVTTNHDFETRGYYSAAIVDRFFSTYQGKNYTNYNDEDYYELWIRRNDKKENPDRPWVVIKNNQYKYYANFDWYNYFFDMSKPTWQHNLTVNGGDDKTQWLMSGGFYSQDGIMRKNTDNFERINFRSKTKTQVNKWFSLSNNITYFRSRYKYPGPSGMNNLFNAVQMHALASIPATNPDGTAVYKNTAVSSYELANGISSILEYGKNKNEDIHDNFQTTFETVLTPVKDFSLVANYTYRYFRYYNMNRQVRIPYSEKPGVIEYRTIQDLLFESNQDWKYHGYNVFGTYENTCAKVHNIKIMGGVNYETEFHKTMRASRNDLLSEDLNDFNLAKGDQISLNGGKERYALLGFFYRFNYDYLSKYLFEASGRYDGSSRFPRHHRYGFFPSFSVGWRISEEKFFSPLRSFVDNMKIRLSYGSLGNQQVGYYDYMQVINSGSQINYSFGNDQKITGASVSAPNSSDLTWEKVLTYNAGLDIALFNNKLSFSADSYIRDTKDMLMAGKDLPAVYGASSPKANAANLRTKGYELSASWNDSFNVLSSPLHYGITLGFGDSKTKITKYDNPNMTIGTYYKGLELGSIWGFVADGFFKTDEEAAKYPVDQTYLNSMINISVIDNGLHAGDIKFIDLDGDGKITPTTSAKELKDYRIIGNSLPRWTYSGIIDLDWKGVGISAFLQGVVRQHWYPASETSLFWGPYARPYQSFIPSDFLSKVWTPENPNSYFPRPRGYVAFAGDGGSRELTRPNTMYLQNAGYLRLKNLTVSYTLPNRWMHFFSMEKVRIYFSGENLFTISGLDTKYIDPEMAAAGYSTSSNAGHRDANGYPISKTYSFGLNVIF